MHRFCMIRGLNLELHNLLGTGCSRTMVSIRMYVLLGMGGVHSLAKYSTTATWKQKEPLESQILSYHS